MLRNHELLLASENGLKFIKIFKQHHCDPHIKELDEKYEIVANLGFYKFNEIETLNGDIIIFNFDNGIYQCLLL